MRRDWRRSMSSQSGDVGEGTASAWGGRDVFLTKIGHGAVSITALNAVTYLDMSAAPVRPATPPRRRWRSWRGRQARKSPATAASAATGRQDSGRYPAW
jgi:hypothetical protein